MTKGNDEHTHAHDDHDHDDHASRHGEHGEHDDHEHDVPEGVWGWFISHIPFLSHQGHDHGREGSLANDRVLLNNQEGVRVIWLALAILTVTTLLQILIVYLSGSVALLADTAHNLVDALNSIPLLVALYLARRAANRRYNYGYGKAEDIAGIFIALSIAVSAAYIFYESFNKLFDPQPLANPWWVAAAAVIGFLGNEGVAWLEIRTGRKIGSAAMVADGLHARTDGLTSLAVLPAALGSVLGFPIIDPLVGFAIGIIILFITRDVLVSMWYRLMDAIEPETLDEAERVVAQVADVKDVERVRLRWMGSRQQADVTISVDGSLTTAESHEIAERVRHKLFHALTNLGEVMVHVEPWSPEGQDFHPDTATHEPPPKKLAA